MTECLRDSRIDWNLLEAYRFDRSRFLEDVAALVGGRATKDATCVAGSIEPVGAVDDLLSKDAADLDARLSAGNDALRSGRVAVAVLNGGMATRFGGVAKGVVPVFGGLSFLELAARDVALARELYGAPIPFVIMNSFATCEDTRAHVLERRGLGLPPSDLLSFEQSISIRLERSGELFIGRDGKPSYYAPGHGDFFDAIRASGVLARLRDRGIAWLLVSNVDNLGATIDPLVLGHHIASGREMTCEVTEKRCWPSGVWDRGGAPARIDGMVRILEGFRLPGTFPAESLPDFSTNNMIFATAALDRDFHLPRWATEKNVEGRIAIQFESILGEAGGGCEADGRAGLSLHLLRVPRDGDRGRFFPIKQPEDLEILRDGIEARLEAGWAERAREFARFARAR